MPNITQIDLTNSVVSAFRPARTRSDNTVAEFESGTVPAVSPSLRVTSRKQDNLAHRTILKFEFPYVVAEPGTVGSVVDVDIVEVNIRSSALHTAAERLTFTDTVIEVLNTAMVRDIMHKGEGFW